MPFAGMWTRVGLRKHALDRGAHWRNLANTTEPSMCGSDAALFVKLLWQFVTIDYGPRKATVWSRSPDAVILCRWRWCDWTLAVRPPVPLSLTDRWRFVEPPPDGVTCCFTGGTSVCRKTDSAKLMSADRIGGFSACTSTLEMWTDRGNSH